MFTRQLLHRLLGSCERGFFPSSLHFDICNREIFKQRFQKLLWIMIKLDIYNNSSENNWLHIFRKNLNWNNETRRKILWNLLIVTFLPSECCLTEIAIKRIERTSFQKKSILSKKSALSLPSKISSTIFYLSKHLQLPRHDVESWKLNFVKPKLPNFSQLCISSL